MRTRQPTRSLSLALAAPLRGWLARAPTNQGRLCKVCVSFKFLAMQFGWSPPMFRAVCVEYVPKFRATKLRKLRRKSAMA